MKNTNSKGQQEFLSLIKDVKIPILVLDTRWHKIFPPEHKPASVAALEDKVNRLLQEQGRLGNELKNLKRTKKKLMDNIVANMGKISEKKAKTDKRLVEEMNQRIKDDSNKILDMPYEIQKANQELLLTGMTICYDRMNADNQELKELEEEIKRLRELLGEKVERKVALEEATQSMYSFLHDMLGPQAIEFMDHKD